MRFLDILHDDPKANIKFLQDDVYESDEELEQSITENILQKTSLAAVTTTSTIEAVCAVIWHDLQEEIFPSTRQELPEELRSYFTFRDDLTIVHSRRSHHVR